MGWFWGSSQSNASQPSQDAYDKLDPALRDFLEKESPYRYQPAPKPKQEKQEEETLRSQIGLTRPTPSAADSAASSDRPNRVPKESLYQDGRYAHLWKNYVPISDVEASERSDQDRLNDVIEAYKNRKAEIGRVAVENCIFEQIAEHECFSNGGLQAKLTMCRAENRAFNRCYTMQSRFLKALGYMSTQRTPEEEERIQMHADSLYREMISREEAIAKAKEEGLPEPTFKPLLNNASAAGAMGVTSAPPTKSPVSSAIAEATGKTGVQPQQAPTQVPKKEGLDMYAAEKREAIEKMLAGKSPAERELEIQLMVAESNANVEYGEKIQDYFKEEQKHRMDRKERGRETFGDTIKRLWGWDR